MARAADAVLEGVEAAAGLFDRDFLPDHFADGAATRYGFTKRSGEGEPARVYRDGGEGGQLVKRGGVVRRLISNPRYYWQKQRRGFGTTLIAELPRRRLNAEVVLDYAPRGLQWSLRGDGLLVEEEAAVPAQ